MQQCRTGILQREPAEPRSTSSSNRTALVGGMVGGVAVGHRQTVRRHSLVRVVTGLQRLNPVTAPGPVRLRGSARGRVPLGGRAPPAPHTRTPSL